MGDKSLVVWEVASGKIVASTGVGDVEMTAVAWGGAAKDVGPPPRTTASRQRASLHRNSVATELYTSTLTGTKFNTGARPCVRDYVRSSPRTATGCFVAATATSPSLTLRLCVEAPPCCGGGVLTIDVSGNDSIIAAVTAP